MAVKDSIYKIKEKTWRLIYLDNEERKKKNSNRKLIQWSNSHDDYIVVVVNRNRQLFITYILHHIYHRYWDGQNKIESINVITIEIDKSLVMSLNQTNGSEKKGRLHFFPNELTRKRICEKKNSIENQQSTTLIEQRTFLVIIICFWRFKFKRIWFFNYQ